MEEALAAMLPKRHGVEVGVSQQSGGLLPACPQQELLTEAGLGLVAGWDRLAAMLGDG